MKIRKVTANNRKKAFEVWTASKHFFFPYAKLEVQPAREDPIERVFVDKEFGREAFTYFLASGAEGTVHIDYVLEYNEDPSYMRDLMLYKLTLGYGKDKPEDRAAGSPGGAAGGGFGELVEDPQCGVYIPRDAAVMNSNGVPFCSQECLEAHAKKDA